MGKLDINKAIILEICKRISKLGLDGKIDVFPVQNTFTHRPRYWEEGGVGMFKVLMWSINSLEGKELSDEIDKRIREARAHFGV